MGRREGLGLDADQHQAHLDMFAPWPQAEYGVCHRRRMPKRVERDMCAAFGDILNRLDHVAFAIDGRDRAKLLGQSQFRRVEIDPDRIRTRRAGDHHG